MKKILSATCAMMLASAGMMANAQQLPNFGFENWETCESQKTSDGTPGTGDSYGMDSKTGYRTRPGSEPVGWNGSSVNQTVKVIVSFNKQEELIFTEKEGGYGGTLSAKLINKKVEVAGVGSTAPGYLTLGTPWVYASSKISDCDGGTFGGIEFKSKPDAIKGQFKRTDKNDENSYVIAYLWNGSFKSKIGKKGSPSETFENVERAILGKVAPDEATGKLVANCEYSFKPTNDDWQEIEVPLTYVEGAGDPAMMNVIISAGDYWTRGNLKENTTLLVDDVELVYYSRLASVSLNGDVITLEEGKYDYTVGKVLNFSEEQIIATALGQSATATVSVDAKNALISVTVTNASGVDSDGLSSHNYTFQYLKPAAIETLSFNGMPVSVEDDVYDYNFPIALDFDESQISVALNSEDLTNKVSVDKENGVVTISLYRGATEEPETVYTFRFATQTILGLDIENGSFEDWKETAGSTFTSNNGTFYDANVYSARPGVEPASWNGSSVNQMGLVSEVLVSEGKSADGSKSVVLTNKFAGIAPAMGSNAPAYITYGMPWVFITFPVADSDGGTFGGANFTAKPDAIAGSYKRTFGEEDTEKVEKAHVIAYLWNGTYKSELKATSGAMVVNDADRAIFGKTEALESGKLIASLDYEISGELTDWTDVVVPFNYVEENLSETPEKANVIISSADYWNRKNIKAGNTLEADNVRFVYYSTLENLSTADETLTLTDVIFDEEGVATFQMESNIFPTAESISYTAKSQFATVDVEVLKEQDLVKVTVSNQGGKDVDGLTQHVYNLQYEAGTSGVESVAGDGVKIYAAAGCVVVEGAEGVAQVYTADGKQVAVESVNGKAEIALANGLYIVRVGNKVQKVVVK